MSKTIDEELERLSALRRELAGMVEHWPSGREEEQGGRWHCDEEVIPARQAFRLALRRPVRMPAGSERRSESIQRR